MELSHQYPLCLKDVSEAKEVEEGNSTITVEEVEGFGCCKGCIPDFRYLKRQGQEVIVKQERYKPMRFLVK